MSRHAWMTLGTSIVFTACSATYVHWAQINDHEKMYQNVINDIAKEKSETQSSHDSRNSSSSDCSTGLCDLKTSRIVIEE